MKLLTYQDSSGQNHLGILCDGRILNLRQASQGELPDDMLDFLQLGDAGMQAISDFVNEGGRLVTIESATDFAIDLFDLDIVNATEGLPAQDFYIPGSILRLELEGASGIIDGLGSESVAWYWRKTKTGWNG